jgi:hypothetical protein
MNCFIPENLFHPSDRRSISDGYRVICGTRMSGDHVGVQGEILRPRGRFCGQEVGDGDVPSELEECCPLEKKPRGMGLLIKCAANQTFPSIQNEIPLVH